MKKEFQAESRRLLDLMIHSIYTDKEIFLRELISNASDATDKRYYNVLQTGGEALNRSDLPIELAVDKEARTLTLRDHGIGMTQEELEENLGVIAHSGSSDFKKDVEESDEIDIIGQFGVGFYSAFMVADKVTVLTRHMDSDTAFLWESDGVDGYTISKAEKEEPGTEITLTIMENTEEEDYDKFLEEWQITNLITKHSDYIRYPIQMELEKSRPVEGAEGEEPAYESYREVDTLNSMTPIWKKRKSEVKQEDYDSFYMEKFYDYQKPLATIYTSGEGAVSYQSLLFIPSHSPMNYYSAEYEKGLQLYASGVLIMDKCADLLPDYFGFVKGVVDSQDLSLNISREMLQQDRQLRAIAGRLEKKIQSELTTMQKNKREDYEAFFQNFGLSIKFGVYSEYGMHKETLQDLLLYPSSNGGMTTLAEYVSRMPESQEFIYYATGDSIAQIENLPAAELVRDKGFEILYMMDDVDEFVAMTLNSYEEKELRSIAKGDLGLETEEEKEKVESQSKESQPLFDAMKEALGDKVTEVTLSHRLKNHPVCLTSKGEISLEMEKVLATMPGNEGLKAQRVLEINPTHPVFDTLTTLLAEDKDKLTTYAQLLYGQALILEGMDLDDPVAFSNALTSLLEEN